VCESGYEKSKDMFACSMCNYKDGYLSVDSFHSMIGGAIGTQRQICSKGSGSKFTLLLIIGAVVLLVVVVAIVLMPKTQGAF